MKKAEDYLKEYVGRRFPNLPYESEEIDIIHAIQQAQVDAIEETCKVCAENASIDLYDFIGSSFKKFEQDNHYIINDGSYIEISKDSILNCAEILKKETE